MLVVSTFPTYKQWLGGRESTDAMKKAYFAAKDAYTPSRPPGSGSTSPTPSAVGSGTRTNGSRIRTNPRFDTTGVRVDPSRIRTESYTPPSRGPWGKPGAGTPNPSANITAEQSMKISGAGSRTAWNARPSGGTPTVPSRESTIDARMAEAAKKLASRRAAAKPGMPKPDTNFGRNLKGGIVGGVVTHMLEDAGKAGSAALSGDWKGAMQRGLDIVHHTPLGFGQSAGDAAAFAAGQKSFRDAPSGMLDRVLHGKYLPSDRYAGSEKKPNAAQMPPNPIPDKPKGVGKKPLNPAPDQPSSIPDMGRQGRAQGKALRDPESYLGSAFDATLRKGISTGRNYLQNQMNKDGLDSDMQSKIMARYNDKIAEDKLLSAKGNEEGLVGAINRNDANRPGATAGRGERTLDAYRQVSPQGKYGKGAQADEIQRKFVKQ